MILNPYSSSAVIRSEVVQKQLTLLHLGWRFLSAVTACVTLLVFCLACSAGPSKSGNVRAAGNQSVPVSVVSAVEKDLPVYLVGLGSVTPLNTVSIKSRVDGQLVTVAYKEGQTVK